MSIQMQNLLLQAQKKAQWEQIAEIMSLGQEFTLPGLQQIMMTRFGVYASETGISARIRELTHGKKPGYTIAKRTENSRTWYYRLVRNG